MIGTKAIFCAMSVQGVLSSRPSCPIIQRHLRENDRDETIGTCLAAVIVQCKCRFQRTVAKSGTAGKDRNIGASACDDPLDWFLKFLFLVSTFLLYCLFFVLVLYCSFFVFLVVLFILCISLLNCSFFVFFFV